MLISILFKLKILYPARKLISFKLHLINSTTRYKLLTKETFYRDICMIFKYSRLSLNILSSAKSLKVYTESYSLLRVGNNEPIVSNVFNSSIWKLK